MTEPLFRKIDCLRLYIPDLEAGLAFYMQNLGHILKWRTATSAGLSMPETDAELVLQTEDQRQEVDLLVNAVDSAIERFSAAGGKVVVPPFDIAIGKCTIVEDPWGNPLVLLDMSQGPLETDALGNVIDK